MTAENANQDPPMVNSSGDPAMLPYATPVSPSGSPVVAAVWITLAGLAMIFLGGCFLIGVMICNFNKTGNEPFIVILYALAFCCMGAAVFLLVQGIRKLLAVGRL